MNKLVRNYTASGTVGL